MCNSFLFGLPANLFTRLQSVQNAAARLIFRIRRSQHITPALISLHWLRVQTPWSASPSNWQCWRTDQSTALYLATYRRVSLVSPTWHQDDGCGLLPLTVYYHPFGKRAFPVAGAVERPSAPRHICTVTRGFQTASQDFPLFSFLPGHPDMT